MRANPARPPAEFMAQQVSACVGRRSLLPVSAVLRLPINKGQRPSVATVYRILADNDKADSTG